MKVSWILALVVGLLMHSSNSRFSGPTKDFIKNKRMHHKGSIRMNVAKYLRKISPTKRRQIRKKAWKKKHLARLSNGHHKQLHPKFAVHPSIVERRVHRNMKKFERDTNKKRRNMRKLRRQKQLTQRRKRLVMRKKKERRNVDELRRRMAAKSRGKTLSRRVYPTSKTLRPRLIKQNRVATVRSRFLKNKPVSQEKQTPNVLAKAESVVKADAPEDKDDDIKFSDHSATKVPTSAKIYASKPEIKEIKSNPNAIQIDRKLLEVSDYADYSPKNEYATQQVCQMRQKQALVIAREIVTQQSKRLFEKLTNYLLKGKLLVNLTKQKVNKALAGKIKELLKPSHVGFTMEDIEKIESEFQNPMDENLDDAEDYVTKQTYDEFKNFSEGLPNDDKIKWNLD